MHLTACSPHSKAKQGNAAALKQFCINSITRLGLPGTRDRGRPRKTWSACVRNMTICNLDGVNPLDRNSWRTSVRPTGVAYHGVRDNCSTVNTKTGYDDDPSRHHATYDSYSTHISLTAIFQVKPC